MEQLPSLPAGLVLMKHEPRIVMAKEVLEIATSKVRVDYEFRNDSDEDITTLVAFPVPSYTFEQAVEAFFGDAKFDDFHLFVENEPKNFSVEARAYIGRHEITELLKRERIDISTFGHTSTKEGYDQPSADLQRVSKAAKRRLLAAGAFKGNNPNWRVEKKYYWTQAFPAHRIVRIRHEYSPVIGGSNTIALGFDTKKPNLTMDEKAYLEEYRSLCIDPVLERKLNQERRSDVRVPYNYVDFILTTANTWRTPIEDFTLIVDRPAPRKSLATHPTMKNEMLVSFCWNGVVEKIDPTHFRAHTIKFVPSKELHVGFIGVEQVNPEKY